VTIFQKTFKNLQTVAGLKTLPHERSFGEGFQAYYEQNCGMPLRAFHRIRQIEDFIYRPILLKLERQEAQSTRLFLMA
jgi:hypothetical protein